MRAAIAAFLVLALGCASAHDRAQATTTAAARATYATDLVLAVRYAEAADEALAEAASLVDYREKIQGWDRVETTLRVSKATLLAAQTALDVWEATGEDPGVWPILACLGAHLGTLAELVETLAPDLDLTAVRAFLPLVEGVAAGECYR